MEYNTTRNHMQMPEYGRNVQKMVKHILTIEDKEKRLRNAELIVELMATLNPHVKLQEDYKLKLWDHLYLMTDYKLDVAGPYPTPDKAQKAERPKPLPYPQFSMRERHLGRNLQSLMKKGLAEKDAERRQGYTQSVGYYMKLAYTNWHKEPIHDDMIKNELSVLTDGVMQFETGGFKVHFDGRTANNFRRQGNNRNFKGGNNNRNSNNSGNRNNNNSGGGYSGGGSGGYNKGRKYKQNKNKNY